MQKENVSCKIMKFTEISRCFMENFDLFSERNRFARKTAWLEIKSFIEGAKALQSV